MFDTTAALVPVEPTGVPAILVADLDAAADLAREEKAPATRRAYEATSRHSRLGAVRAD